MKILFLTIEPLNPWAWPHQKLKILASNSLFRSSSWACPGQRLANLLLLVESSDSPCQIHLDKVHEQGKSARNVWRTSLRSCCWRRFVAFCIPSWIDVGVLLDLLPIILMLLLYWDITYKLCIASKLETIKSLRKLMEYVFRSFNFSN